jgi:NAD(P)-dependent dehydrogenase (short-subunit alcohol dehydrogenase family)
MQKDVLNKFSLKDRVALVTGGAGLLGEEHAYALLESGATVILTDIDLRKLKLAKDSLSSHYDSSRIITYRMDVTDIDNIMSISEELIINNLHVDILINNAAIDPKVRPNKKVSNTSRLEHFNLEQWNAEIAVGLTGAFLCSKIFGEHMSKDSRGGVILNIASDLSVFSPDQRLYRKDGVKDSQQPVKPITYSVIKAGLVGMTRYLSTYWAEQGVRANALSPGGVFNGQDDDFVKKLSSLIPLGRMANHDEYRAAVQFLCSDASSYMNGQNIVIDGGRSAW